MVLHVQDGGREEGDETEVEQALAAAARESGAELHVRGSQLRLSLSVPTGAGLNSHDRGIRITVSSARILAVDDETSTAQALAEMLALWGHKVETAGDGTEALKKAAEFRPDVVLSDLACPRPTDCGSCAR